MDVTLVSICHHHQFSLFFLQYLHAPNVSFLILDGICASGRFMPQTSTGDCLVHKLFPWRISSRVPRSALFVLREWCHVLKSPKGLLASTLVPVRVEHLATFRAHCNPAHLWGFRESHDSFDRLRVSKGLPTCREEHLQRLGARKLSDCRYYHRC